MSHRDQFQKKFKPGAKVKAIFDFHGTSVDDLSFKKEEVLTIVKISRDPNWYQARNSKGKNGMVPANHLEDFSEKKEVKLHAMPWFHGKITREKAEELMHPPRDGTFLVRESTHFQGDYSLSVSYKNSVEHYRIIYSKNQLTVDEETYFENLFQLVEHYQKDADGLCCKLEYPLQKKGSMNVAVDSKSFIESGWAIERSKIIFTGTLASGNFGDVREGTYQDKRVAIKLLKDDDKAAQAFLAEASVMTSLKHPNLVQLLGVVLGTPLLLVMEFMSKGNLVEYLRSRGRSVVTADQLLQFSTDCAKGMAYLEKKNLVHRDLAARNILISEEDIAKVSDFGLTAAAEHMQIGKELPIRWTAPESLDTKEFTTKSDVWSFGILLWEVYSYGKVPYPRVPLADIRKFVNNNYRMEPPEGCPQFIYKLMTDCWKMNPKDRPTFQNMVSRLESVQGSIRR
ncbi:Tyrosine-protein kinase CSK [Holothuria leucospilota]|uniref:Tyrosine-protein kinase n=1 Tax=Holothuria leucospilota TaxID=206669 RepID=A0A9Q1BM28_HOLLE|nr:Tyrosine-protein kinase CSK [Holothuria leucospilota]